MVELLCVIAILVGLAAVALPSMKTMLLMPARKTAVDQLLNVFEDARIAALSSGANSYVAFATEGNSSIPAAALYHEFIIFRDKTDDDATTAPNYIQLTKWQSLPQGVSFQSKTGLFSTSAPVAPYDGIPLPPGSSSGSLQNLPLVEFTPTGAVSQPTNNLYLYVYEGFFSNARDMDVPTSSNTAYLDRLSLSHYTGRVQVDVVKSSGS